MRLCRGRSCWIGRVQQFVYILEAVHTFRTAAVLSRLRMSAAVSQDKTSNRIAVCSAIFAGFAYVGYAVVRQTFGRKWDRPGFLRNENDALGLDYEPERQGKVYLRRLSGSCAGKKGDVLLDTGQPIDRPSCVLRPLSVRERIRELNLNATAFADTILMLQGRKPSEIGARSLGASPFHSPPRILSPLDTQQLPFLEYSADRPSCPSTPRLSRRASKRNLSRRSLASSVLSLSEAQQEEADARAESLLQGREGELTRRLESLQNGRNRELTPYECKSLVALLHSSDAEKVQRTLTTVANAAAFTRNQDSLREAGVLVRLPSLLASPERSIKEAAVLAAANLALNVGNMKEMEGCVNVLTLLAENGEDDTDLHLSVLECLTNICVLPDWHHHFHPLLKNLLVSLSSPYSSIRIQTLRLLINLACNQEMMSPLLSTQFQCSESSPLFNLLNPSTPEEELLRSTTLVANICVTGSRLDLARDTSYNQEAENTLRHRLFHSQRETIARQALYLRDNHLSSEIKYQSSKIYTVLHGIQE